MINVALVDDHTIVRSGFAQLLAMEESIQVVGEFGSAKAARAGLPGLGVHVCVIDVSMPDENGFSLVADLPKGIACVMLSVHNELSVVDKALSMGVLGYLTKRCSPEELVQAVYAAAKGDRYFAADIHAQLTAPQQANPVTLLTKREREICELLSMGLSVKDVATHLNLSYKTVHVHRANAFEKLDITNSVTLSRFFKPM